MSTETAMVQSAPSAPTSAPNPAPASEFVSEPVRPAHAGARRKSRRPPALTRGTPGDIPALAVAAASGLLGIIIGYILGARDRRVADDQKRRCARISEPPPPIARRAHLPARPHSSRPVRPPSHSRESRSAPQRAVAPPTPGLKSPRLGENTTGIRVPRTPRALAAALARASLDARTDEPPSRGDSARDAAEDADAWTPANFRRWCRLKMGDGETVRWYTTGDLYEYPTGRLLARVEGLDVTRAVVDDPDAVAHQLSRKFFIFRHPETREVITERDGQPVEPVRYPYQHVLYRRVVRERGEDENEASATAAEVVAEVTTGRGEDATTMRGSSVAVSRSFSDAAASFSCPVFLHLDTEDGPFEAYENYEYFGEGTGSGSNSSAKGASVGSAGHCAWTRFGATPPFGNRCVLKATSWRVGDEKDLPASIRAYLDEQPKMWREAPRDMDEIEALRAGKANA